MRPANLITVFRDEKREYHIGIMKNMGLIKELINKSLHSFFNDNSIYAFLKNQFQNISLMSITKTFYETCNIKFSDYKDVIDCTVHYKLAYQRFEV